MSDLDEEIANLRHDDGCSAGIDAAYRCRCRLEARRADARAELDGLRGEPGSAVRDRSIGEAFLRAVETQDAVTVGRMLREVRR